MSNENISKYSELLRKHKSFPWLVFFNSPTVDLLKITICHQHVVFPSETDQTVNLFKNIKYALCSFGEDLPTHNFSITIFSGNNTNSERYVFLP